MFNCLSCFCSCWKVADWSEGPCSQVHSLSASSRDTSRSPKMERQRAKSRSRARCLRRVSAAAPVSPLLSRSRRSHSTPTTMRRSSTCCPSRPHQSAWRTATRCMLEPSSVSRPHPVSYPNLPAIGWERTSLSAAAKAGSRWVFTSSRCWRCRINLDHSSSFKLELVWFVLNSKKRKTKKEKKNYELNLT